MAHRSVLLWLNLAVAVLLPTDANSQNASPVEYMRGDQAEYLSRIFDNAQQGSPQSKYEAWQIVTFCKRDARRFQGLSELEAQRLGKPDMRALQRVSDQYALCGRFYTEGFGNFPDPFSFRSEAAAAGYPPAVIEVAIGELLVGRDEDVTAIGSRIVQAINSGHPEALVLARSLEYLGVINQTTGLALIVAACDLGYDCHRKSVLMIEICSVSQATCSPDDTFVSLLHKGMSAAAFSSVIREANRVKEELDADGIDLARFVWNARNVRQPRFVPFTGAW